MPTGNTRRKALLILCVVLCALVVLIVCLPFWFPWVLRPLAKKAGLSYGHYTRNGYTALSLSNVGLTNSGTRVQVQQLRLLQPTAWVWRLLFRADQPSPIVTASNWSVVHLASPARPSKPPASAYSSADQITRILTKLKRWLPTAKLVSGRIQTGKLQLLVPTADWSHGVLGARVLPAGSPYPIRLKGTLLTQGMDLEYKTESPELIGRAHVSFVPAGFHVDSTNRLYGNQVELTGQFDKTGQLPASAKLAMPKAHFDAALLRLPQYRSLEGSLNAEWRAGQFSFLVAAHAKPTTTNYPPIDAQIEVTGDTNAALIQTVQISSPWLQAALRSPVQIFFKPPYVREPALLNLQADLTKQSWLQLKGQAEGQLHLSMGTNAYPLAEFTLTGSEIGTTQWQARTLSTKATLNWPILDIPELTAELLDGSRASANSTLDLRSNTITAGNVKVTGRLPEGWLPKGAALSGLTTTVQFHGAITNLAHHGTVEATSVSLPTVRPFAFKANWRGNQLTLGQFSLGASFPQAEAQCAGSLDYRPNALSLVLTNLSFQNRAAPFNLSLSHPFKLALAKAGAQKQWTVETTPLDLAGGKMKLSAAGKVQWPNAGHFELSASHVDSGPLSVILSNPPPQITVNELTCRGDWSNSPLSASAILMATAAPGLGVDGAPSNTLTRFVQVPLALTLEGATGPGGTVISNLTVSSQSTNALQATGSLPLTFQPSDGRKLVRLSENQPVSFSGEIKPEAFLWRVLTAGSGLQVSNPAAVIKISGTLNAPEGVVQLRADELALRRSARTLPKITQAALDVRLDRANARIENGKMLLAGQAVEFSGDLPLSSNLWTRLKAKDYAALRTGRAHLRVPDAELAPFAEFYPTVLSPQGRLSLDLTVQPGPHLQGYLAIQRARTRPFANLGPIRDINIRCEFVERALRLNSATARVGGSQVTITAQADLSRLDWLEGEIPPFQCTLSGSDVPLSRQPESIIRSDLNLMIVKTNREPPLISGSAMLVNSYYLADLDSLSGGKLASPKRRPPYFSIEDPLLADCPLRVKVTGERFLRVRSPIFNGEISANINLQGTLKDPVAVGDLRINSGIVNFPFASLEVQQGLVMLSPDDPYRPQLNVTAASKQFGYDIRMEASGFAEAPVIQFTSNPPLSSEQILLLVTAGEMPREEQVLSTQQRAQTFAMFLGKDLLSKLGFGDQTEQRLTIYSGEEITEQGTPTYRIEYKLSDRWSVTGEYDRFNEYNIGMKWRIYSK